MIMISQHHQDRSSIILNRMSMHMAVEMIATMTDIITH